MPLWDRIALLTDDNSFVELDREMKSVDPLEFIDSKSYPERLAISVNKTDVFEAVTCGRGAINQSPILLAVMNFEFMGGSMGSVVGEKITRLLELGVEEKTPVIVVSASGGARMQEGILSLMQMAKTSAAIQKMNVAKVPFFSILTDPTSGGVSASFASLGDVNIAEPGAYIGFAGPRVIEQTIRQKLPEGFQRAEFLLEHGMIDAVVHRRVLKNTLAKLIKLFGS
jgi:acetyl-CoA carboxylase carboxyl transferase subunit beta